MARAEGLKVGFVRPITIWPFAEKQMQDLAGKVPVSLFAKYDNESATPAELLAEIKKAMA